MPYDEEEKENEYHEEEEEVSRRRRQRQKKLLLESIDSWWLRGEGAIELGMIRDQQLPERTSNGFTASRGLQK